MRNGRIAYNRPESRYAWRGSSLLVLDNNGRAGEAALSGFYFRETRFLRDLQFELNGERPAVCSASSAASNRLEFAFIYPEGSEGTGSHHGLPYRNVDGIAVYTVHPAWLDVSLSMTSRWCDQAEIDFSWRLSADYAGLTESDAGKREIEGEVSARFADNALEFSFQYPALPFRTRITTEGGQSWTWDSTGDGSRLHSRIVVGRQETITIRLHIEAIDFDDPIARPDADRREQAIEAWLSDTARIVAPAEHPFVMLANDAIRDVGLLALLEGTPEQWLTPAAGVPLFLNLWARDALTAGWQLAPFDGSALIGSTLSTLAPLQGRMLDPARDEQPGRIVNRVQRQPSTRAGRNPFDRFYPDFASPLMFIIGLGQSFAWTGRRQLLESFWPNVEATLSWAENYGDRDGDGYLEYLTESPQGPKHQGWKDSENAVVDDRGRQVDPPIAVCEIQGYYYAALQFASVFAATLGHVRRFREIRKRARRLKQQFNRDFWMDDEGYVAFGLDSDKRVIRSVTSNAAQCLATGIVSDEHAPHLVRRMFQPDLFSGWGIRTLSAGHPAFNPLSYHLGSVWSVENGTILLGLRRYGFDAEAETLARALYDLALLWDQWRIPECVGGYGRQEYAHPAAFVHANAPQAWNQSVFAIVLQSLLGMRAVAALHLLIVDPVLPDWLPEIVVENLRVGDARITLRFYRDDRGRSHFEAIAKEGSLHVVRQPPLDSLSAGIRDRFGALVKFPQL